jgi:hypothetical protein
MMLRSDPVAELIATVLMVLLKYLFIFAVSSAMLVMQVVNQIFVVLAYPASLWRGKRR